MPSAPHPLTQLLLGLETWSRERLADAFAERARTLGLIYLAPEGPKPIPVVFPPIIEARQRTEARAALAREVTAAVASAARRILDGALGEGLADELLAELAPIEREIVSSRYASLDRLATVRADLFEDASGNDRLLELNSTIPAMQAYSDIAAQAFVEATLEILGGDGAEGAREILALNGSNSDDLLRSLLACYRAEGGAAPTPSIALVHRPGDSQLFELRFLAERFRASGHRAETVEVGSIRLEEDGAAAVVESGFRPDILYRHVFATRVDPRSDFAAILRAPEGHGLFNQVAPHLEQKGILAEVSVAAADPDRSKHLGISPHQAALIRRHVPWTRRLRPGTSTDPRGAPLPELIDFAIRGQAGLVLKRSWDFGGKGVFLGAEYGDASSLARAATRFQERRLSSRVPDPLEALSHPGGGLHASDPLDWAGLVDACVQERGWIVQERVPLEQRRVLLAGGAGAVPGEVFIDISSFTNLGGAIEAAAAPRGGVCRASSSAIVNIQSGGGVVPLLSREAADLLVSRLSRRP